MFKYQGVSNAVVEPVSLVTGAGSVAVGGSVEGGGSSGGGGSVARVLEAVAESGGGSSGGDSPVSEPPAGGEVGLPTPPLGALPTPHTPASVRMAPFSENTHTDSPVTRS